ncbi:MAG: hypothetical protein ABI947_16340 [Chloroflexota bacterium]
MSDEQDRLIYLAGSLYSKSLELKKLLHKLEETEAPHGEIRLSHRSADGESVTLLIHIDGTEFTMMPENSDPGFRLDISDLSIKIE